MSASHEGGAEEDVRHVCGAGAWPVSWGGERLCRKRSAEGSQQPVLFHFLPDPCHRPDSIRFWYCAGGVEFKKPRSEPEGEWFSDAGTRDRYHLCQGDSGFDNKIKYRNEV